MHNTPQKVPAGSWLLGSDIGGTFTDLFLFNTATEEIAIFKIPSTPTNPAQGLLEGVETILAQENLHPSDLISFVHGTTVATNALLELKGVRTGLITTRGFRDLLEIRRQRRPTLYDLFFDKPEPLVPRHLRLEVTERCDNRGQVVIPLDINEVEVAIQQLKAAQVQAIAVCFLYAYLNPVHELQVARKLEELYPEAYVCLSSQVLPEWREFERCSTTTANAYLGPIIKRYLTNLHQNTTALGLLTAPRIMQSNGGIMSITAAADRAVYTLFSGPSAGVIGGQYLAVAAGYQNIITFDMGGTSTDVSLIENGMPKYTTEKEINGVPLKIPMIDIHTVGAGGGSIAWIDSGGLLKVGPQSMGAHPGPACYGLGGTEPTVTDVNVLLGRLNPAYLLGGRMPIEADLSRSVLQEKIARPLGLSLEEAAAGILTIVNTNMVLAVRLISIQRGYDPRDFVLVAFGGAGPLHAAAIAQELNIAKILIPPSPGTVCALGLLVADTRADYVLTRKLPVQQADLEEINALFQRLETEAETWLAEESIPPERRIIQRTVDMRYSRQNYELSVPALPGIWNQESIAAMNQRFHDVHQKTYGYAVPEEPTHFINFRVTAMGITHRPLFKERKTRQPLPRKDRIPHREVYFQETKSFQLCPIFERDWLSMGDVLAGPAIIEQMDATTVIHPEQQATVDPYGNLIITL